MEEGHRHEEENPDGHAVQQDKIGRIPRRRIDQQGRPPETVRSQCSQQSQQHNNGEDVPNAPASIGSDNERAVTAHPDTQRTAEKQGFRATPDVGSKKREADWQPRQHEQQDSAAHEQNCLVRGNVMGESQPTGYEYNEACQT